MKETELYGPVKAFLQSLGFSVKGEIGNCDIVALGPDEPPALIVCEMKLSFSLELLLQAVDRAASADEVWLAAPLGRRRGRESDPRFRALCRRLGFGLLGVSPGGDVTVLLSPAAAMPRRDGKRRSRLIEEHRRRHGDPNKGGGSRQPIMTAYRQQVLACAVQMLSGPRRLRDLKPVVPDVSAIVRRNVYGWFERVGYGVYGLTTPGREAVERWPDPLGAGVATDPPPGG